METHTKYDPLFYTMVRSAQHLSDRGEPSNRQIFVLDLGNVRRHILRGSVRKPGVWQATSADFLSSMHSI
jgi:hypothetical protein